MTDNFTIIKDYFANDIYSLPDCLDKFLFGQIIIRKKDGTGHTESNNKIIKDLVFRTHEEFDTKKVEITRICDTLGARAYVNLNPRSFRTTALKMAISCLTYLEQGNEAAARGAFASACGKYKAPASTNTWLIDIDEPGIEDTVTQLVQCFTPVLLRVPTVNGVHLITRGFDLRTIRDNYPEATIHKNNPTLLYAPSMP